MRKAVSFDDEWWSVGVLTEPPFMEIVYNSLWMKPENLLPTEPL